MKLQEIMSQHVVRIQPEESVSVAARMLERYNVGCLPVCGENGKLHGVVTDRDIVTRCLASGRDPGKTAVGDVMTSGIVTAPPDMDTALAASLMGRQQIRRLLVVDRERLCGVVSLGDLAVEEASSVDAGDALAEISGHLSSRD